MWFITVGQLHWPWSDPWLSARVANEGEGSFVSETSTRPVSGLSAMKLDELKGVASSMGITGTTRMRKSDLVEAIKARQAGGSTAAPVAGDAAPAAPGWVVGGSTGNPCFDAVTPNACPRMVF